jgi:glycosyltransferase involved in cell wall biosynthesis
MIDLVGILVSKGFRVLVVLPGRGMMEKVLRVKSIPFMVVRYSWWVTNTEVTPEQYLDSIHNLISSLPKFVKFDPTCIITNTAVIPWGMLAAQLLNAPHIWNIREFVEKDHGLIPDITFPELAKIIYLGSEKIWFVSKAVREEFEKYIPNDKSEVIYSQVTVSKALSEEKIESPYKYETSFKIVMSSNINPGKGQDQAVKAARVLIDKGHNIELLILGRKIHASNDYYRKVARLIGQKYKDRIHILPFMQNPYPFILKSDLVLVCSRSEAFSRILIESGLLGRTFVASNKGANLEIDRENGLFYEYGNYVDLSEKIKYLIKNPEIRKKMAENLRIEMQKRFQDNKIILELLPKQLREVSKSGELGHTFGLIGRVLMEFYKKDTLKVQQLEAELQAIKSSKNYRLWKKYHRVRDSVKDFLKINE